MAGVKEQRPSIWAVVRDIALLGFGVLIDRTVTYQFPLLAPALPYLWLVVAIWLTREVIDKTPLRRVIIRAYSRWEGKKRLALFGLLFLLGGSLLCFYWWGINRFFQNEESFSVEVRSGFVSDKG